MCIEIAIEKLRAYRLETFHLKKPLSSKENATEFVNERGFIYFWPIRNILFPSLWTAVAGDRPVADEHDDPGHITWEWKDSLLGKHVWYYAKVLRKKATILSLELAPYFYALSENYGSPEEDYLTMYEQGRLTQEARLVYEALIDHGPLDTVALRKAAHMTSKESDSRFSRALADLQAAFMIVPVGVTDAGAWHYAFAYDLVARAYPELPDQSRFIGELEARDKLVMTYFTSMGAAQFRDLAMLFQWNTAQLTESLDRLSRKRFLLKGARLENQPGEWFTLPQLIE
jgi:hypothetical protein